FQQGVGYLRGGGRYTAGFSVFNLRGASGPRNEGMGYAGRVTFAPVNDGDNTLHFGAWGSHENANKGSADLRASAGYAGRRGPSQTIDRKSTRLNSSHVKISYAVFCLKKKKNWNHTHIR